MPPGADKGFTFDPPGAIGLDRDDARVLFRFHDPFEIRPRDEAGSVDDLTNLETEIPTVVPAACGNGRLFDADEGTALFAKDVSAPGSLITRDLTIMAIVSWDIALQASESGSTSTSILLSRGSGADAEPVLEQICYQLRLSVIDAPSRRGSMALAWHDTAASLHVQAAAEFAVPTGFTLLTATRRWASPTEVICHYYIGDTLIAEIASTDGDIGGATSGTFTVGADRLDGDSLVDFFVGTLDELAIYDREMCIEEIGDVWNRITVFQPLGVQLYRELHDPGFPLPDDPASDGQLETRQIGMALGYAASKIENIRRNILPQHCYGRVLELWEEVLRPTRLPTQLPDSGIDARRARVLARIRQRGGSSIPALQGLLGVLLGGADPVGDLQFLSFTNTVRDDFATLDLLRWDVHPDGSTTAVSGKALMQAGTGTFTAPSTWITMRRSAGGDCKQVHRIVKVSPDTTTTVLATEGGIYFSDGGAGNYLLLGIRDTGGTWAVFTEAFVGGVSGGAVNQATLGGAPTAIWLWLYQTPVDGTWAVQWSLTSGTEDFTDPVEIAFPTVAHWAGSYIRSQGAIAGGTKYNFDADILFTPFGFGPFNAYVLLDRDLGFIPDLPGSRQCVAAVKHAFIHGTFITEPFLLCDDQDNGCDQAPLGGY